MTHATIRSAISHLYFESIRPFEDGNGRIGRTIAEKALSQTVDCPMLLSLSAIIEKNKKDYYIALKDAQQSNEITDWLTYFIDLILNAQDSSERLVDFTLKKIRFFERYQNLLMIGNKRPLTECWKKVRMALREA